MVKWLAAAGSFGALAGCSGELVPYAAERPIEISAAEQVILQDRKQAEDSLWNPCLLQTGKEDRRSR